MFKLFLLAFAVPKGRGVSTLWIYLISSVVEWEEGLTAAATRHFVHLAAGKVRVNLAYLLTHCKEDPNLYIFIN